MVNFSKFSLIWNYFRKWEKILFKTKIENKKGAGISRHETFKINMDWCCRVSKLRALRLQKFLFLIPCGTFFALMTRYHNLHYTHDNIANLYRFWSTIRAKQTTLRLTCLNSNSNLTTKWFFQEDCFRCAVWHYTYRVNATTSKHCLFGIATAAMWMLQIINFDKIFRKLNLALKFELSLK